MTAQADWLQARTGAIATAFPAIAERHRKAIGALRRSVQRRQPLAVLVGEGRFETDHVLRRFLSALAPDITAVFVNQDFPSAEQGMRALTHALGFDPSGLSVDDLRGVLRLFLENQQTHRRRTVIVVEHVSGHGDWLLALVAELVEAERENGYGLTVVMAGTPQSLAERFQSAAPESLQRQVRRCLVELKRFTPTETALFVRDRLRAAGIAEVAQLFEFAAIARLHELTAGIPDDVAELCRRCLVRARLENLGRISEADVDAARDSDPEAGELSLASVDTPLDPTLNEAMPPNGDADRCLVVRLDGQWLDERLLGGQSSLVIGRAETSDVHLPSPYVSRAHALLTSTADGHEIRDLGSRNGTFVGDERITQRLLAPNDIVRIGHFLVEYKAVEALTAEPERTGSDRVVPLAGARQAG